MDRPDVQAGLLEFDHQRHDQVVGTRQPVVRLGLLVAIPARDAVAVVPVGQDHRTRRNRKTKCLDISGIVDHPDLVQYACVVVALPGFPSGAHRAASPSVIESPHIGERFEKSPDQLEAVCLVFRSRLLVREDVVTGWSNAEDPMTPVVGRPPRGVIL